ncbi:MAG: HAD family hydrolase [Acidobacteriia bacterium]|nr:HAD family hydrolase [Terriglobia bacterium]
MTIRIACSAVLFDLDGVLIDSTPAVTRVWQSWAARHGFDPEEVVRKAHGRPSIATIREYLPNADHELENRIVERAEIADLEGVAPLPGALELLRSLPSGCWAIVTSCTRPLAKVRIATAGLPVPRHLLTADDITHGKPHPEPYLKGAEMLGVSPQHCIVIEDVPAGIGSGKAAGARVIAVRTTATDEDLRGAGADWIVDGCGSISVERGVGRDVIVLVVDDKLGR